MKNGGLTDEQNKAQAAMRAAEREKRVKESLMMATGAKRRTDSAMDEVVVDEVEVFPADGGDVDDNSSVATDMSYMTKQRLKEQEVRRSCVERSDEL